MKDLFDRAHELWLMGYDIACIYCAHSRRVELTVAHRTLTFQGKGLFSRALAHVEASLAFMSPDPALAAERGTAYAEVD